MPVIRLNTVFSVVPTLPGTLVWGDGFDRPDGDGLGVTDIGGLAWDVYHDDGETPVVGEIVGGRANIRGSGTGVGFAIVDDGMSEYRYKGTYFGDTLEGSGLAFRVASSTQYWRMWASPSNGWRLMVRDGGYEALVNTGVAPSVGDVVAVEDDGSTVTVEVNGEVVATSSDPRFAGATGKGFVSYVSQSAQRFWDDFECRTI